MAAAQQDITLPLRIAMPPPHHGFVSPAHTPQGSPSKQKVPPGAIDISNDMICPASPKEHVFDNSTGKLMGRGALQRHKENTQPSAPTVGFSLKSSQPDENLYLPDRGYTSDLSPREPLARNLPPLAPNSPKRRELDALASSRAIPRGLSAHDLEKLQKPSVKRLTSVTQLYFLDYYFDLLSYVGSRESRLAQFKEQNPEPPATPQADYDASYNKLLGRERAYLRKRRTRLRSGDFQILTQVGQGGYGQVFLAQKKDSKEVCALKVMSKKLLFKMDEVRHVLTERDILTNANSDWLVKLLYSFQDDRSIYLAMEYVPGGDFRTLLNNTGVLHNRHARFYIAEMFASVDALHQLGYIHRDLKPENFLVDSTGHIKLTDFGLASGMLVPAKVESMRVRLEQVGETRVPFSTPMSQRTVAERQQGYRNLRERDQNYAKSIVGSPDYMAPEVLKNSGKGSYDFTVDYWSLGAMLFEALSGYPPFAGATVEETWQNLKHWDQVFKKPVYEDPNYFLSTRTWNLICKCITTAERRFRSFNEIKQHPYFREVSFKDLRDPEKGEKAPFIPELDGETDAGYFDDFGSEKDMAKYKEVHDKQKQLEDLADRGEKMGKGLFVGFTFRHRKAGPGDKKVMDTLQEDDEDAGFGTMF